MVIERFPNARVQALLTAVDVIDVKCNEIFRDRKAALEDGDGIVADQVAEGKDILSVLSTVWVIALIQKTLTCLHSVKANMNAAAGDRMPDHEVVGQMR